MDFNLKSKFWVGNIYHQFESLCQDVDGFVNKDTVKFVGNQVQSVGISVKRLCSNVVQEMLPLSEDIAKTKQQLTAGEQVDIQDHVSVSGIITTFTCTDEKKLRENQVSNDHKIRISDPSDSPEAQTCQHSRECSNAIVQNSEDGNCSEKNISNDLKPMAANSFLDGEIFPGKSDEDYISSSPAFSAGEEDSISIEKERIGFNHKKGVEGFSDDIECLSDTSSSGLLSECKLPMIADPYSDENGSLSSPSVPVSTHKVNEDVCQLIDLPLPPCDTDDRAFEKDSAPCESCYIKDESVDLSSSAQSSECGFSNYNCNKKEQMVIMSSTYCASPKSSITMDSTSIDNNALLSDRSELVIGLSESSHEEHYMDGFSSETDNIYGFSVAIDDLDLETIDLSQNVKHEGRSVVPNIDFVQAGSYRRRNFRYYKNLIQGAFTSHKRLSKEYEQLAIMYGDIDIESKHQVEPSSRYSFPNSTLHDAVGTESYLEMSENEWELL